MQLDDNFYWLFQCVCFRVSTLYIFFLNYFTHSFAFLFFYFLTFLSYNLASSNQDNPSNKRPCIRIQNGAPKASVDLIAILAAAADKPCSEGKSKKNKN